jgi:pimeloyl-ACP methyl ester carboxylesterase
MPLEPRDVWNDQVRLACTDHGGDGPSLVLLHGLGMSQRSMHLVAQRLIGWRVITMDLRGHGESTTGDWSFANAVNDVQAVIDSYGLQLPYLGGHSLGGMVALRCALAGVPTMGVVNIDGWGPGTTARHYGEDPARVGPYLQRIADGHLPSRAGALITQRSRHWREGTTQRVLRELYEADVVAWHRAAPCPSLALFAASPTGRAERWLVGAAAARMQGVHRLGLRQDLRALTAESPVARLVEVQAGHSLIRTHPDVVAAAMDEFRDSMLMQRPHGT